MSVRSLRLSVAVLSLAVVAALPCPVAAQEPRPTDPSARGEERPASTTEVFKGIYLSFWSASVSSRVENAIQLAQQGLINTVVIDVKDAQGRVGFDSRVPQVIEYRARERIIRDLAALVRKLHAGGLHVVARMVMFNDPVLAQARPELAVHARRCSAREGRSRLQGHSWYAKRSLQWVDRGRVTSDYNIAIARTCCRVESTK